MVGHTSRQTTFDTKHIGKYFRGRLRKILVHEIFRIFFHGNIGIYMKFVGTYLLLPAKNGFLTAV